MFVCDAVSVGNPCLAPSKWWTGSPRSLSIRLYTCVYSNVQTLDHAQIALRDQLLHWGIVCNDSQITSRLASVRIATRCSQCRANGVLFCGKPMVLSSARAECAQDKCT